nr:hypothetical protein [uncultured Solibaculum sp.]
MEFTFFRCRIRISVTFVTLVAVTVILDTSGMAVWTIGSAFLHEAGHFLAFSFLGSPPAQVELLPFGMRMETSKGLSLGYAKEALACLAGPMVNLLLFLVFSILGKSLGLQWMAVPAAVNLVLGGFNLLPVAPLDGGQTLFCILCLFLEEKWSNRIICVLSVIVLLPVSILSFTIMLRSGFNITLLVTVTYLILLFAKSQRYSPGIHG